MKKGPLSKEEKKFIEEKYQSEQISVMATQLNRSAGIVEKHVSTLSSGSRAPSASNLYARKKERGVTVSTQQASMDADEKRATRKEAANGVIGKGTYIHTIK